MIGMLKKVRSLLKLFSRNCFIYFLRGLTQRSTSQVTACFDFEKKERKHKYISNATDPSNNSFILFCCERRKCLYYSTLIK